MMIKRGLAVAIFLIFAVSIVYAANDTGLTSSTSVDNSDAVAKGYKCLEDSIKNKTLSLQEATFAALALGAKGNVEDTLKNEKSNDNCWPKSGCKIKETAQAMMAYQAMGKNTADIEKWLSTKNVTSASDLNWYLQVDIANHEGANCSVEYGNKKQNVKVLKDMKLQISGSGCLSLSSSGYWMKISTSNDCLDETYKTSCDGDFVTNLLYEKTGVGTIYVSSETHSSASLGKTEEKVESFCFKQGNACDFEGTIWAVLALQKKGHSISPYMPYLLTESEDNKEVFPAAFLYALTSRADYYSDVVQLQKGGKYWEIVGSKYGRFYDTSLALMALSNDGGTEVDNTKSYLFSIQDKNGCWNNGNVRDTAFLLYSGWPKSRATASDGSGVELCEASGASRFCETRADCEGAGGQLLNNFDCTTFGDFCCSVSVQKSSCSSLGGTLCSSNQECKDGYLVNSAEGACCKSACLELQIEQNTCEVAGGTCKSECGTGESEVAETCSASWKLCCVSETKAGFGWLWILLLLILIVIVVLLIVFRERVVMWYHEYKSKKKRDEGKPKGPPEAPAARGQVQQRPMPRMVQPIRRTGMPARSSPKDKELEETLKKLREISK